MLEGSTPWCLSQAWTNSSTSGDGATCSLDRCFPYPHMERVVPAILAHRDERHGSPHTQLRASRGAARTCANCLTDHTLRFSADSEAETAHTPGSKGLGKGGRGRARNGAVVERWQYQTFGYVPTERRQNFLAVAGSSYLNDYPSPDDLRLFMNGYRTDGVVVSWPGSKAESQPKPDVSSRSGTGPSLWPMLISDLSALSSS